MYTDHLEWMINDTFECTHEVTDNTHTRMDKRQMTTLVSIAFTNLGGIIDQSATLQITHHIKCSKVQISFSTVIVDY